MGTILARLTARKDPSSLEGLALNLEQVVARAALSEDPALFEQAFEELDAVITSLSAEQFQLAIAIAANEAKGREEAEEVLEALHWLVEAAATQISSPAGPPQSRLFGVPLYLLGPTVAWQFRFTESQQEQIVQALKDNHILDADAKVTLFPRMMVPVEAEKRLYGHTRRLLNLAHAGEGELLWDAMNEHNDEMGLTSSFKDPGLGGMNVSTVGLLAMAVSSADECPYPLARELAMALPPEPEEGLDRESSPEELEQTREALEDVRTILLPLGAELAKIFGALEVAVGDPVDAWVDGVIGARKIERQMMLTHALKTALKASRLSPEEAYVSSDMEPADPENDEYFLVKLLSSKTNELIQLTGWLPVEGEDVEDCELSLRALLQSIGLAIREEGPTERAVFVPASPLLH